MVTISGVVILLWRLKAFLDREAYHIPTAGNTSQSTLVEVSAFDDVGLGFHHALAFFYRSQVP